jgi:hypothetical protein
MTFEKIWTNLQKDICEGDEICNWTAHNGYLGDRFVVVKVRPKYIEVSAPGAQNVQHITSGEFEKISDVWRDYIRGNIRRAALRDSTRFSKYVISIVHHLGKIGNE